MSRPKHALVLAALTTLGMASAAQAGTFYTVAVFGQSMPGDGGNTFGSFSNNPGLATDGNDVCFIGAPSTSGSANALYDYNIASQSLNLIALSSSTTSPDGSVFTNVGYPSVSNGVVSFNAQTQNNPSVGGIYSATTSGGSLETLADTSTTIPGSSPSATFGTIENIPSMSGTTAIMEGGPAGNSSSGIYLSSNRGAITKVIDDNSGAPSGGGSYGTFDSAVVSGTTIAYMSSTGSGGSVTNIYAASTSGSNPKFIVTANDSNSSGSAVPGGGGTFEAFYGPVTDGTSLAFAAQYNSFNNWGLFVYGAAGGSTGTPVVTSSTQIPGHAGVFFNPGGATTSGYSLSDGILAFNGVSSTGTYEGIYSYNIGTGTISPVYLAGGTLDGHTVTDVELLGQSTANGIDEYAFVAYWSGGEGIFVDPVPEPASLALLGVGSLMILRRRRLVLN